MRINQNYTTLSLGFTIYWQYPLQWGKIPLQKKCPLSDGEAPTFELWGVWGQLFITSAPFKKI